MDFAVEGSVQFVREQHREENSLCLWTHGPIPWGCRANGRISSSPPPRVLWLPCVGDGMNSVYRTSRNSALNMYSLT